MPTDPRPIGVFDSGIGGLSVLKHLARLLPQETFVYLGDTARVPYGNKSAETVRLYSSQCAAFLLTHNVKMIVVACNTASALALDTLRASLTIPVVGVIEPAAREAVSRTRNGHIGVIGTRATVASDSYARCIERYAEGKTLHVHSRPCPLFVPLVEEGWLDSPATRLIAEEYLRPLVANGIDTLVLGCTHYPLLGPVLSSILPGVELIDCGECAAIDAQHLITAEPQELLHMPLISLYVTDHTPAFTMLARQFLGMPVDEPVRVNVEHLALSSDIR
ncbi:MAG: glutamate racemase [Candidatus Kapabacteria bacterium]|nr:glutamate racemase [Candidatus Kapabacteria bacterium]